MVSDKLKQIIFKQLYKELSNIEIIPYKGSIYFIDRENKYWYFEYEKSGMLWWRYDFFTNFFLIFSLELDDYQKVMGDWVEEVLNCKVNTTKKAVGSLDKSVEEVLNSKVSQTSAAIPSNEEIIEKVLNHKVTSTNFGGELMYPLVGEILSYKVTSTEKVHGILPPFVDEVLNEKN